MGILTTKQASDEAHVPGQTICRWIREGRFSATRRLKHYGAWRIDADSFRAYLAAEANASIAA
jgi:hypothetical protein